jgi:heme A synthase
MVTLHGGLARATVFYSLIMGLWALWRFMRREEASPGFSGALVIAEILYLAQGVVGVILVLTGSLDELARPSVHILYGAVTVLILPAVYIYTRGDQTRRVMLIYGLAFLFLAAMLYFRGISTGYEKTSPAESGVTLQVEQFEAPRKSNWRIDGLPETDAAWLKL